MELLYNSEAFVVMQFTLAGEAADGANGANGANGSNGARGGYEIVDKFARKEIYLQGAVAQSFQRGVEALVQQGPSEESLDAYIAGFTVMAQQPVVLH